ncbi:unnamed protein product [Caenorhabditis brenneri]
MADEITRFQLLELPPRAINRIIGYMSINDALIMSFISHRCLKIVSGAIRYPEHLKMDIRITSDDFSISLYQEELQAIPGTSFRETNNIIKFECRKFEGNWFAGKKFSDLHGNLIFGVKLPTGEYVGFYQYFPPRSHEVDVYTSHLIGHLLALFPRLTVYLLTADFDAFRENFLVERAFATLRTVEHVELLGRDRRLKVPIILTLIEVTRTFDSTQVQHSRRTAHPAQLRCTESIDIGCAAWMSRASLLSLNCPLIFLQRTKFCRVDIFGFLEKWKTYDDGSMDRIKIVEIQVPPAVLEMDILRRLGGQRWNPARRPQRFEFEDWDCKDGTDIYRADGRIGTVLQCPPYIVRFVVWPA